MKIISTIKQMLGIGMSDLDIAILEYDVAFEEMKSTQLAYIERRVEINENLKKDIQSCMN